MTVLFTSVGRRVVYLRQIRAAADRRAMSVEFVGSDIDKLASALNVVDRARLAPRSDDPGYLDFLIDTCRRDSVGLIVPLTDPDARLLALHRRRFEELGVVAAAVAPERAEIIDDKWQTAEFFATRGVDAPKCWLEVPDIDPSTELLIKPRRGSAGKGIVSLDRTRTAPLPPDTMVQERVVGPEITVDVFCGRDGQCLSIGMRERLEVRGGEVSKARTVYDLDVERAVLAVVHDLGAIGPITLQCFLTEHGPKFIEINGRAGGGIPLSIHAGSRSDELLLDLLSDEGVDSHDLARAVSDVHMTRYDDQFFSDGAPAPFEVRTS